MEMSIGHKRCRTIFRGIKSCKMRNNRRRIMKLIIKMWRIRRGKIIYVIKMVIRGKIRSITKQRDTRLRNRIPETPP